MTVHYESPIHDVIVMFDGDAPRAATLIPRFDDDHWIKTYYPRPEFL